MKIGIHLPNAIPGVTAESVLEWARRADEGPFASLAAADRLHYQNLDPTVALASAAAVTERVELIPNVLVAPVKPAAVFAKEAASLAVMAPGRFTLGVGVGARPADYESAGVPWNERGRRMDEILAAVGALHGRDDAPQCVGPDPGEIPILIGGASPPALQRIVDHGVGFIGGGVIPPVFAAACEAVREAWSAAGREGEPRLVAGTWYASTPDVLEQGTRWRDDYFVLGGPPPPICEPIHCGVDALVQVSEAFAEAGADETIYFPVSDDIRELEWLAELAPKL
jgi:alkanesulfonate monooxygenase SsuD/methylene tetrahydromethanopterin reductase-like flavin-dependent oxidoreductase (luciferase family)